MSANYRERILTELRLVVQERGASAPTGKAAAALRVRRPLVAVGFAVAAVAAVVVAMIVPSGGGKALGVIDRAAAAIAPTGADEILHYRIVSGTIYPSYQEVWQTVSEPLLVRTLVEGTNSHNKRCPIDEGYEFEGNRSRVASWDPVTAAIYRTEWSSREGVSFPDPLERVRLGLKHGGFTVAGEDTIGARRVLRFAGSNALSEGYFGDPLRGSAYYVDAETYAPVRWVVDEAKGTYYDVVAFEYLPPTPENTALARLARAHPGAPVRDRPFPITPETCAHG